MIYIGLGANLPSDVGSPELTLVAAARAFEEHGITLLRLSPFYMSAPVPASNQPWFVNAVAAVETDLSPLALLDALLAIEKKFGRDRQEETNFATQKDGQKNGQKNKPRPLDLDLLDYNRMVIEEAGLTLPHPAMHTRAFVLVPLFDLDPNWVHPVKRKKIRDLMRDIGPDQVVEPLVS